MKLNSLATFLANYDFPFHLIVVSDLVRRGISTRFHTAITRAKLYLLRCRVGVNLRVDGRTYISVRRKNAIRIGDDVKINSRFASNLVGITNPTVLQCIANGTIHIGNNTGLSAAVLSSRSSITLGQRVFVGANVRIFDHDFHSTDPEHRLDRSNSRHIHIKSKSVTIGDDVFIGTNAIILKGVIIGDRAIVGAGAVVTRHVPADEVWAGNPATCRSRLHRGI
ncbi:acyltransferase [Thiorhodococcus minor]|uniref:Acyltransferase n=1 Tax=Thiorhodococcus minor TaxID=57489 RepID=A0A6M0K996_9GAMM|nr:acyltransferase [Thiorhodococcus minor]NEV65055.1 acyltransferase [Thiorhodococcus minor]